ncbi:MAG: xanthan lyase [Paludibacter sp.]|nr:xanthan lyase [Paludibacter sp.]
MIKKHRLIILLVIWGFSQQNLLFGQKILEQRISDSLTVIANTSIFSAKINRIKISVDRPRKTITVTAADNFGHIPFRWENVDRINHALKSILGKTYPNYKIRAQAYNKNIEELIPNYLLEKPDDSKSFKTASLYPPLLTKLSTPYTIDNGLTNRNIALWNSHGRHFNQKDKKWAWQRPLLFLTVEDLLTTAFVLPFLTPMLENAGAQIFIPRERDTQTLEVIVDNDDDKGLSTYQESNNKNHWRKGEKGFSNEKVFYLYKENPFEMGTSRKIKTTTEPDETSFVAWTPYIPEKGTYAVYVSYQTTENSTEDAHYTVHHLGGTTAFAVNQTVYGGTWLYLGHFKFDKGLNQHGKVVLTNLSRENQKMLTADAVKFGGGMGNIAVMPKKNNENGEILPVTSNFPRYTEGAKYWLQWAGAPDTIYSRTANTDEYSDDFQSRGFWINYLAGGSSVIPNTPGLGIPIDLALAFHTDAGIKTNDSIIGTLAICTVGNNNGTEIFKNGVSRWGTRDMVDLIQTQIVEDIRKLHHPTWTRRGLWNRSYSEARVPEVPTMLLELLSHQNFEDMKYALDPRFRFSVSRSIYKGILKHFAYLYGQDYVVQPLPVEQFSCKFISDNRIKLQWKAVSDSLEPSAEADNFVVYTRINDRGFDNGRLVSSNNFELDVIPGQIYSFKIAALNRGGVSFPSEILSAYRDEVNKETVLIVNGFERISGPENFNLISLAGFLTDKDAGVPYLMDLNFIGEQYEFSPYAIYRGNENPGFGASKIDYESQVIAGNTFDYPFLHGKSIQSAGYSFVSASVKSVISGDINLHNFKAVNLILGKQKQTLSGNIKKKPEFKTFPLDLQLKLNNFCRDGGNLMVSGSYIASDMYAGKQKEDIEFIENLLKIRLLDMDTVMFSGILYQSKHPDFFKGKRQFEYFNTPNNQMYAAEAPDIIEPIHKDAFVICQYEGSNHGAGVAYSGAYKVCSFGFPFETIKDEESRDKLMSTVLKFFFNNTN